MYVKSYLTKNTPIVKKVMPRTIKNGHVEKDKKSNNGNQGQHSDSADGNLIITIQAAKCY